MAEKFSALSHVLSQTPTRSHAAGFGGKTAIIDDPTGIGWNGATTNERERVGIVKICAIYVHDNLDSTHGALHHGGYLCVWSRVTAYSRSPRDGYPSRHDGFQEHTACRAYNRRIAHTRGKEVRMETVNVTVRMERQTRDDAAKLFSELGISTTQAINMFLKQAVREQRIPFEVSARPALERGIENMEK